MSTSYTGIGVYKLYTFAIALILIHIQIDAQVPYGKEGLLPTITERVEFSQEQGDFSVEAALRLTKDELRRLDVDYSHVEFPDFGNKPSFYPSIYINNHKNSSLLLVFPLTNNPLLISSGIYTATMSGVFPLSVLLVAPYNTESDRMNQVTELLRQDDTAVIWFDKKLTASSLNALGGRNKHIPPLLLSKTVLRQLRDINVAARTHALQHSDVFDYHVHEIPLERLLEKKIPAMYLESSQNIVEDEQAWQYSLAHGLGNISRELQQYSKQYTENWEENYLSWRIFNNTFFISERALIIFLFLLMMSTLFYGIFFRSILFVYVQRIIKHWFVVLCIFLIAALVNVTSTFIVWFFVHVLGNDLLFERWTIFLKLALFFFLFTVLYRQLARTPAFWARNRYLSATSLLLLVILILLLSSQTVTLTFYFGISYLMVFFFSITRKTIVKFLFLVLAIIPQFYGIYSIVSIPSQEIISFLLYDLLLGNLLWTIFLLPYILIIVRIDHLRPHRHKRSPSIMVYFSLFIVLFTTLILPLLGTPRIPITLHEVIDARNNEHYLNIESNTNLAGNFHFTFGNTEFTIPIRSGTQTISLPYTQPAIQSSLEINSLAGIYVYDYHISSQGEGAFRYLITHSVQFPNYLTLHYSSIAMSDTIGQRVRTSELNLGTYPPQDLHLECRIASNDPPEVQIEAEYETLTAKFSIRSGQAIQPKIRRTVLLNPKKK